MKEIKLTQGKVTLVDDEDFEWLNKWKWQTMTRVGWEKLQNAGRSTYCSDGKERTLHLHRLIMGLQFGDKRQVDHINRNPLDNRRSNLRICEQRQNSRNRGKTKRNKSGYKGVSFHARTKKWQADIAHEGKGYYLGIHATPKEAALAYNKAARKYHGEFAYQNEVG
jgi:hypothetical protein